MNQLDINQFIVFKTDTKTQELDNNILKKLSILFPENKKNLKKNNNNNNTILKNQKIQSQKENICNKVNLILNKLSEKNIDNLIIEFIDNINQVSPEIFKDIQKTFYLKIISEINFIEIYLEFLIIIGSLYNKVQGYNLSYFYDIIEIKFNYDYLNNEISPINNFLINLNTETTRTNNLILIINMVKHKLFSNDIFKYCDEIILNQNIYYSDIYYWFNYQNKKLTVSEILKIKDILNNNKIPNRDLILLKNIVQNTHTINKLQNPPTINKLQNPPITLPVPNQTSTIDLECAHIIDEYVLLKSIDDLTFFINTRCVDTINKNIFCKNIINNYFLANNTISTDIINLIKQLIKIKILFKSNFSRGLLIIHNDWDELSIDYNNPISKLKTLLTTLKSCGITKGLEVLIKKYNIE